MYDEMMKKAFGQIDPAFEPARRFAELSVSQAEKLAHFQLDASRAYFDLGVEQLRAVSSVRDTASLQDFVSRQQEVASKIGRRLTDDAETLAGFGKAFSEAATGLASESPAAPARPKSAAKTSKSAA